MKKFIIITLAIIALLLVAVISIPYFFKDQIISIVKKEINSSVNSKVDFSDVSISMIKSFPNLSVGISELSLVGIDDFANDTLVYVRSVDGTVNIWKAIKGEYEITKISVNDANVNVITKLDGKSNYDISKETSADEDESSKSNDVNKGLSIALKHFEINNANIVYIDSTSEIYTAIKNLNVDLSGDFSSEESQMDLKSSVESLLYRYAGVNYLSDATAKFDTKIDADIKNSKYTFKENSLFLNNFEMNIDGWVQLFDDYTSMDLKFGAKESTLKNLLNLIPTAYESYIKGIDTKGKFVFKGYAKGKYTDVAYPEFGLISSIEDGYVKYPDLPQAVNNINVDMNITHPDNTDLDAMVISINNCSFSTVGNEFKSKWTFKHPMSDIVILGSVDGNIDLKKLGQALPLGDLKIDGAIKAKIDLNGKMSQIEKEQYDQFKASGYVNAKGINIQTSGLKSPILIDEANMSFSPQAIDLSKMDILIGKSDFHLVGKVTDYISYIFKGGTLGANFNYSSKLIDVNELMNLSVDETNNNSKSKTTDSSNLMFQIPNSINFSLTTKVDKINYEKLSITNTQGKLTIKDSKAILSNINTHLLDGSMTMNGTYNAQNEKAHSTKMNIDATKINIPKLASSFPSTTKLIPIITHVKGDLSGKIDLEGNYDEGQNIIINSINSTGKINTSVIEIEKFTALEGLTNKIKIPLQYPINIKPINLAYEVKDGKVKIDTFDCTTNDISVKLGGTYGLDQQIDFFVIAPMPVNLLSKSFDSSKPFGSKITKDNSKLNNVPVVVNIKGDMKNPSYSLDLTEAKTLIKKEVDSKVSKHLNDVLGGLIN